MNLAELILPHPDSAPALLSRGEPMTYAEMRAAVDRLRAGLVDLGIVPGDRLATAVANNRNFAVTYFAALGAGAVVVPLNPTSPAAELRAELEAVGARSVVVGPTARTAMAGVMTAGEPTLEHVLVTEGVDLADARSLSELGGGLSAPIVERAPDDLATLIFTAGTSGTPKAAMLSHGNLLANLDQMQRHPGHAVRSDDVLLGVLPMFHIFGLNVLLGLAMKAGASIVLVERFDPASALDTIRDRGVTIVAGAPAMYAAWAALPNADPDAFRTVRVAASGAAPLPADVTHGFEARFGVTILEGYGLTEAAPTVTSSIGRPPRPGSIGVPLPGIEVRLVDDGHDAFEGDAGEVWVRGPNVFAGYWNDSETTAQVLTDDGWLRTGDVATVDDDGYLYLVDRAKDLVIVSGFNVYPAEVEGVLASHPRVREVAVAGVAHPHTGETVKAYVVTDGAAVDEDDLIEFCAARLARYKCPTKITFVPELPKGLAGKLLRRALP